VFWIGASISRGAEPRAATEIGEPVRESGQHPAGTNHAMEPWPSSDDADPGL
jgi:hypothetical protein